MEYYAIAVFKVAWSVGLVEVERFSCESIQSVVGNFLVPYICRTDREIKGICSFDSLSDYSPGGERITKI